MNSLLILDVVIGLVFVYLLYSMLATIVQEFIATLFSFRAKVLERAIFRMLEDGKLFDRRFSSIKALFKKESPFSKGRNLVTLFYEHPTVKYLSEGKRNDKPSYISKEYFSRVIIDLLRGENIKQGDDIKPLIEKALSDGIIPGTEIRIGEETLKQLRSLWFESEGEVQKLRTLLEEWFDATMQRCSGWYKAKTQYILLFIGLVTAIVFNVDTIAITGKLQKDPALRESMVQQADKFIKDHPKLYDKGLQKIKQTDTTKLAKTDSALMDRGTMLIQKADSLVKTDLTKTNGLLGLGWEGFSFSKLGQSVQTASKSGIWSFLYFILVGIWIGLGKLIGWLVTALAISLGAPFWFDLLNKLMKLRTSIKIPGVSEEDEKKK